MEGKKVGREMVYNKIFAMTMQIIILNSTDISTHGTNNPKQECLNLCSFLIHSWFSYFC